MKLKHNFEMAPLADHWVVVASDRETGEHVKVFTLNGSAAEMLQLLLSGNEPGDVASDIARRYEAPLDIVTRDVQAFVQRLQSL